MALQGPCNIKVLLELVEVGAVKALRIRGELKWKKRHILR
jgi:hypothetical protein